MIAYIAIFWYIYFWKSPNGLALADLSDAPVKAMTQAVYKDTLYATVDGNLHGIYRSDDNGRSWQMVDAGPAANINAIAVHPTNERVLFAGTTGGSESYDGALWYSKDLGKTWQQYGFTLPANDEGQYPAMTALTVDPNHPGVLYIGTEGQGLYRLQSGYGGLTPVGGTSLQNLYVKDIVVVPDSPIYVVAAGELLTLQGDAWRKIDTLPDAAVSLAIDPANPKTLYAGTVSYGAYRSTDSGQNWQSINQDLGLQPGLILRVPAIAVDKNNPQHLALATAYGIGSRLIGDGIYESFDAGESWTKLGDTQELVSSLTIKQGNVYAATAKGLARYGDSPPAADGFWSGFYSLANPTGVQMLILVSTAGVAVWMLVGRLTLAPQRVKTSR